jgi:RNA polymerase sigma factor (sigma-70 family)
MVAYMSGIQSGISNVIVVIVVVRKLGGNSCTVIFFSFLFFLNYDTIPLTMSFPKNLLRSNDQAIISGLLQTGIEKRKAEDGLFTACSYFIREGMHKYALQEEEAFDAYSDSVLAAIQKICDGSFEGRSSLKTWLFQIFQNKCVDLIRKKTTNKNSIHKTAPVSDMLFQLSDAAKTIIQQLVERSDVDLLKKRLNELGTKCRELLLLSADGYSDKELSAQLEYKSADVVKTSRLRCLEKLRQLYKNPLQNG